ncbi:MAG: ATP-dependent sacrificial sulfur transferase LarE, partial [Clostridia bacterium]|nr:ATP-dependent sacrificial sulfur transferase LarE [Clostridia bacterium]
AVAFSSGVDSTLLLKICANTLGKENVIAITACSVAFPEREQNESIEFCKSEGIKQIKFNINQLEIPGFCSNPPDRCYICKKAIFTELCDIAKNENCDCVFEGSNLDDDNDYRPGMRAIKELGVISPLRQAELTKAEIRKLSANLNLKTAKKPSLACLATRFEYGDTITEGKLKMIDKAEQKLIELGLNQVRVRLHGKTARIEVEKSQMQTVLDNKDEITEAFKSYGFDYITLDLNGYTQGSMNKSIGK